MAEAYSFPHLFEIYAGIATENGQRILSTSAVINHSRINRAVNVPGLKMVLNKRSIQVFLKLKLIELHMNDSIRVECTVDISVISELDENYLSIPTSYS